MPGWEELYDSEWLVSIPDEGLEQESTVQARGNGGLWGAEEGACEQRQTVARKMGGIRHKSTVDIKLFICHRTKNLVKHLVLYSSAQSSLQFKPLFCYWQIASTNQLRIVYVLYMFILPSWQRQHVPSDPKCLLLSTLWKMFEDYYYTQIHVISTVSLICSIESEYTPSIRKCIQMEFSVTKNKQLWYS